MSMSRTMPFFRSFVVATACFLRRSVGSGRWGGRAGADTDPNLDKSNGGSGGDRHRPAAHCGYEVVHRPGRPRRRPGRRRRE
ncbi:hypothetical protein [Ornithinimicrobium kibberense]|uniref:hypothetical protein n=1 Tax=Ornithinimicrobium kibberense TaxID=282060 RepID=UPI00361B9B1C